MDTELCRDDHEYNKRNHLSALIFATIILYTGGDINKF